MKIAIIDSGVDRIFLRDHPITLAGAATFNLDAAAAALDIRCYDRAELQAWQRGRLDTGLDDEHGHGTAVLSILCDRARPDATVEFYLAKILDHRMQGYTPCLIEALAWLIDTVMPDFINLSLGTPQTQLAWRLAPLVQRAVRSGTTLLCAAGGVPSLPAQLDDVVSVADHGLTRSAGAAIRIDRIVTGTQVRVYRAGRWVDHPMTTSYACAVAMADAMYARMPNRPP